MTGLFFSPSLCVCICSACVTTLPRGRALPCPSACHSRSRALDSTAALPPEQLPSGTASHPLLSLLQLTRSSSAYQDESSSARCRHRAPLPGAGGPSSPPFFFCLPFFSPLPLLFFLDTFPCLSSRRLLCSRSP